MISLSCPLFDLRSGTLLSMMSFRVLSCLGLVYCFVFYVLCCVFMCWYSLTCFEWLESSITTLCVLWLSFMFVVLVDSESFAFFVWLCSRRVSCRCSFDDVLCLTFFSSIYLFGRLCFFVDVLPTVGFLWCSLMFPCRSLSCCCLMFCVWFVYCLS